MRCTSLGLIVFTATLTMAAPSLAQPASSSSPKPAVKPLAPPIQSGVYGFSGGRAPGADVPEGVVGECVWIFDEHNKSQVAKGDCTERQPGKFRVVLKPGHYVFHGPGGNKAIEIKAGQWVKLDSVALLPGAL